MPFFTFPFALAAAVALPALVAVYWLRNKHRKKVVSSLMLFMDRQRPREGGMRVERSGLPPLFWLELLALLLLVLGATDPQFRLSREERPLVIILDDSYTMLAGAHESPRSRAETKLASVLGDNAGEPIRLILAGREPSVLGEILRSPKEASPLLASWTCRAPTADITRALAMARETGGPFARILILTDAAPPEALATAERMRWCGFGESRSNLAIVNASRVLYEGKHRVLLEIANCSDHATTTSLHIDRSGPGADANQTSPLELAPREIKRLVFEIPATSATLTVSLPEDSLSIDNLIILPPPPERTVRLKQEITNPQLRTLITDAVEATGQSQNVTTNPDLILSDAPAADAAPTNTSDAWTVRFINRKPAQAYLGPFVLDRTHPMTQGLSLDGVIWSGDSTTTTQPTTEPAASQTQPASDSSQGVIMAGNVPLVTDQLHNDGTHALTIHFHPELSTLQQTPGWPVLLWNLVHWRSLELPGPARSLVRLGESLDVTLPRDAVSLRLTDPLGRTQDFRSSGRRVTVPCDVVGQYQILAGTDRYTFSCAPMNPDGSDLTHKSSGEWGQWKEQGETRSAYRPIGWALALVALMTLFVHALLIRRGAELGKS